MKEGASVKARDVNRGCHFISYFSKNELGPS